MIAALHVQQGGLHTTVQDLGRYGWQSMGVPVSGALDATALRVANTLVGNAPDVAALEILGTGPVLEINATRVRLALAGADASIQLLSPSRRDLPSFESFCLRRGDVLRIGSLTKGAVTYLAIEGGVNRTSGLAVQGVGATNREQVEQVFYRAFTTLLPRSATFSMARAGTIQAAGDLYGTGGAVQRALCERVALRVLGDQRLGRAVHTRAMKVEIRRQAIDEARAVEDAAALPHAVIRRLHHGEVPLVPASFEIGADSRACGHVRHSGIFARKLGPWRGKVHPRRGGTRSQCRDKRSCRRHPNR